MSEAKIIDGKAFAAGFREKVAATVTSLKDRHGNTVISACRQNELSGPEV